MSQPYSFEDRQDYIIALAIKSGNTPDKNVFTGMVQNKLKAKFCLSQQTISHDLKLLLAAWIEDRWKSKVQSNPYLTEGEKQLWNDAHSLKPCTD